MKTSESIPKPNDPQLKTQNSKLKTPNRRVLSVFGTRPEVIKMAPVVKALEQCPQIESFVCATSQHRQMQDQMMKLFGLTADFDLDLMTPGQTLTDVTTGVLSGLEKLFKQHQFDVVLVHGDTTTSMVAALAAFYAGIPVGHVEAGLRTYDLQAPFPEEGNRQLTGRVATYHFAPTKTAKSNLLNEQVLEDKIIVTGNTVIDALLYMRERLQVEPSLADGVAKQLPSLFTTQNSPNYVKASMGRHLHAKALKGTPPYVLITGHRRESFGQGFLNICAAIKELSNKYPHWHFVYPVHLNPNVQKPVMELLGNLDNVHLIEPVDYAPFVYLMNHCQIVLTDSGGVQEEAPSLGKPVLVMREVTERPEGVAAGTAKLVGNDKERIVKEVSNLIDYPHEYQKMANAVSPYGDGQAAQRVVGTLSVVSGDS